MYVLVWRFAGFSLLHVIMSSLRHLCIKPSSWNSLSLIFKLGHRKSDTVYHWGPNISQLSYKQTTRVESHE